MTNNNKKYNALRVRMTPLELKFLDAFCEMKKKSRAKIVKLALKSYIYRNIDNLMRQNKKLIFSQNMFKPLFDNADEALIEKIAEISFQNGVSDRKYIENLTDSFTKNSPSGHTLDLEGRVKSLIQDVFKSDAQNWFETVRYGWNKKTMIIGGKHNLGRNFSLFIKLLIIKYMGLYDYELISEEFREKKSEYNNNLIYTVVLNFGPALYRKKS